MAGNTVPGLNDEDDFEIVLTDEAPGIAPPDDDQVEEARGVVEAPVLPDAQEDGAADDDGIVIRRPPREEPVDTHPTTDHEARYRELEEAHKLRYAELELASRAREADAMARRVAAERDGFQVSLHSLDAQIANARRLLAQAKEAGSAQDEVELEERLAELRQVRQQVQATFQQLPDPEQFVREAQEAIAGYQQVRQRLQQRESQAQAGAPVASVRALNPMAERWSRNNPWLSDPRFASERAFLIETNNRLVQEGYDPNGQEFYNELGRRVKRAYPVLDIRTLGGQSTNPTVQRRQGAPVASPRSAASQATRSGGQGTRAKSTVVIGGGDFNFLRSLNLDPTDKNVIKRFAKERAANRSAG